MMFPSSSVSVTATHNQKPQTGDRKEFTKLNWGKNHTTGHKIMPQASNFYTGFLAILYYIGFFFGIHSPWSACTMQVNQQC